MSGAGGGTSELARWLVDERASLVDFVRRRAGRLLLRLETAEDLAQGVCAHLLGREVHQDPNAERELRAWVFTASEHWLSDRRDHWSALKRCGGDVLRRTFADQESADLAVVRELAASVTGPSTFAVRREQLALAAIALDMLLPRDRELIEGLCAGVDLAEQGKQLGISYDAVERARLRALERFRRCFQLARSGHGG